MLTRVRAALFRSPTKRLSSAPATNSQCASLPNVAIRLEKASIDGYVKSHSGRYSSWRIRNGAPSACASAAANGFTICGATRSFAPPATRHSNSAAARPKRDLQQPRRRLRKLGINRKEFFRVGHAAFISRVAVVLSEKPSTPSFAASHGSESRLEQRATRHPPPYRPLQPALAVGRHLGFHLRASFSASAIWSGVILSATISRLLVAVS